MCAGSSYTSILIQKCVRTHSFSGLQPLLSQNVSLTLASKNLRLDCMENNVISEDILKHSQSQQQNHWAEGLHEIRLRVMMEIP